jgi:hypothetical protein
MMHTTFLTSKAFLYSNKIITIASSAQTLINQMRRGMLQYIQREGVIPKGEGKLTQGEWAPCVKRSEPPLKQDMRQGATIESKKK